MVVLPAKPALREQLPSLCRVERELLVELRIVGGRAGRRHLHLRLADPAQDRLGDGLAIQQVSHRLPDLQVVEGRLPRVEDDDVVLVRDRRGLDLQPLGPEPLGVLVGDRVRHVDLARAERVLHRAGIAQHPEDDPVEIRQPRLPVAVVSDERQVVAGHPLTELERPGAAALLLDRGERRRVHHPPAGDHRQEVGPRPGEPEANRPRVELVGRREILEPAEEAAARRLVLDALEVRQERVGVEGSRPSGSARSRGAGTSRSPRPWPAPTTRPGWAAPPGCSSRTSRGSRRAGRTSARSRTRCRSGRGRRCPC